MQNFNTWSCKPWAESTEYASHLTDPGMANQIQSSAEADHTSVMIDHHEMDSTTDSTRTGFAGGRSHVKATELRENPVVKAFLEDLLDEKIHEFQQTLTNTAQRTEELFSTQDGHIQGLKNSQQASTDILLDHIRESKISQQEFTNALLDHVKELKTSQQETINLVRALTQEIAELKSTRKRTADEISGNGIEEDTKSLAEENLRLKKRNFQVEKALDEKEKEYEPMRASLDEALGEIEQLRSTDRTFTVVDDGAIVSQWKELKFLIRNLADQRFNRPIKLPLPSTQHKQNFNLVSAVYPLIVVRRQYISSFFQAVIWRFIAVDVFDSPSRVWGKPLGDVIDESNKGDDLTNLQVKQYHALRAHVCKVLHENSEIDKNRIGFLTRRLNARVHQFDFVRQGPSLESILTKIITKASELAATFAQAKAEYKAHGLYKGSSVMFTNVWMETTGDKVTNRPGIDLIITPALFKYGNSDGENYNEGTVLVKADVI
ncbi:hypothetical protein DL770_003666 [Monosporascus sp. CRB-9-2]|nr:hypothetical protein DL770_003666 [Monosporascus sp. CRB-9-2]